MNKLWLCYCVVLYATNVFGQDFDIFVSDAGNFDSPPWKILKYDSNGENPQVFIDENLAWPQDILFIDSNNTVLISNLNTGRINRYNAATGAYIDNFAQGIGGPTRMKIGADNLLYVLQWTGGGKVKRYQLDGTFVDDFTDVGVGQSIGLDWDSAGNLYVSSFNGKLVRKFDTSGNDMGVFIDSNLSGPTNIWFDSNGDLLVSDYSGTAIKRFDSDGNYLGDFIQGLSQSEGMATLPDGSILIGNGSTSSVKKFTSGGTFIEDTITTGSGGLLRPNAVVIHDSTASSGFQINAGLNDAWFNPAVSGQGFFITVFPDIQQIFLAWFTYDLERPAGNVQAMLGEPGHRWLTAFGAYADHQAVLDIEVTQGGVFDAAMPMPTQDLDGTITLAFTDCTAGTITYDIPSVGQQSVIPIQRIALDNVPYCQSLLAQ